MLDDEGQVGEKSGRLIDVSDIKGVTVKWPDRWAFMNMNVRNPKFYAFFQITHRFRICELVTFRIPLPLSRIKLDPFNAVIVFKGF